MRAIALEEKQSLSGFLNGALRFKLLHPDDVTPAYVNWFQDPEVQKYIEFSKESPCIDTLREFVAAKLNAPDAILLGVFDGNEHVGNIKFEPIDLTKKSAVLGILIGSFDHRSVGLGSAVIKECCTLLKQRFGVVRFELGVHPKNLRAIAAYRRCGFFEINRSDLVGANGSLLMRLEL